jgi:hypothetical protein
MPLNRYPAALLVDHNLRDLTGGTLRSRGQSSAIEIEENIGKIHYDPPLGDPRIGPASAEFSDEPLILFDLPPLIRKTAIGLSDAIIGSIDRAPDYPSGEPPDRGAYRDARTGASGLIPNDSPEPRSKSGTAERARLAGSKLCSFAATHDNTHYDTEYHPARHT